MRSLIWLHVAGGGIGLAAGYAALYSAKGSTAHRRVGRVFVYAMLTMGLTGALIAAMTGVETSVAMGGLAAYLVFTGFTAVAKTPAHASVRLGAALIAFALAALLADIGRRALASPGGVIEGLPAPMAFAFATLAAVAGAADVRLLRSPWPDARTRTVRHLWRMCLALFIAAASFFLGQTDEIPRALHTPLVLVPPVVIPLLAMLYWIWRTRRRRARRISSSGPQLSGTAEP